ncbi:MAG: YlmC/YmxH family sporulation protein [Acetobacteraceae bacterium]|nr:YlmC/YmxH family sporulation protein [Acetobacteraceae bacterium]
MTKSSDLKVRDVVNIVDGRRLGTMSDVEVDLETGKVTAIIVPGPARLWGLLGRQCDYVIPWERVKKIGPDVILVDMPQYEMRE